MAKVSLRVRIEGTVNIQQRLDDDLKQAMRAGEKQRVEVIRMARAALKNAQIALVKDAFDEATSGETPPEGADVGGVDRSVGLSDAQQQEVIAREVKRRRDAIEAYTKAGRPDLAEQEAAEAVVLEAYLPRQLGPDELRPQVAALIAELGLSGPGDMNKLMPTLMQRFKGQAEGRTLSQLARELLADK
jgi:uncharacterized protein